MKKSILAGITTIALIGVLAGCGNSKSSESASSGSSKESASSSSEVSKEPVKISVVGSTALQPLVDAAKDEFQNKYPNYSISVQGGGSGTGLSQVADKAVDIGNSDVFAEEKSGVPADKLVDHKVAVVGMGPVANKDAGVDNLTKDQLKEIFTGKVKNWKEVGGKDLEINVINRASGSGTRATFEKWALDGEEAAQSQEQDSSGTVKQIVAQTPGAISYLAFSYFDDSLKELSVDGVKPTAENVADNKWTIWSYEHMYTNGEPTKEIKAFLDYIVTDEVQKGLVKKLDYLPIIDMKVERSVDGKVTDVK